MNLPYPNPKFVDGRLSKARPCSLPVFSTPLPNSSTQYVLKQKFQQFKNNKVSCPFNAKHPNYTNGVGSYTGPTFILVAESEEIDLAGGVVEWTRTYAAIPASFSEFETFGYTFIGGLFITASPPATWPTILIRQPRAKRVQSRIQYDFFVVGDTFTPGSDDYGAVVGTDLTDDSNATSSGPGTIAAPYDVPGSIPFVYEMLYLAQAYLSGNWLGGVGWLATQVSGTTQPTATQYLKMVTDAQQNAWGATVTQQFFTNLSTTQQIVNPATDDPSGHTSPTPNTIHGGQIPAEDSTLQRWFGNIWMRKTRYVLAQ